MPGREKDMEMIGQEKVYETLEALGIPFGYEEHPAAPTIEISRKYWVDLESTHCKNLFFRNHKGNRHYLVILDCERNLAIRDLEQLLGQGKLTFASERRMEKYLGVKPGSVSPFGLVNDGEHHVHVFLDENLKTKPKLSFHPNDNRASLSVRTGDFIRYMEWTGNGFEWIRLY